VAPHNCVYVYECIVRDTDDSSDLPLENGGATFRGNDDRDASDKYVCGRSRASRTILYTEIHSQEWPLSCLIL
jgi:hypothetical protein